MRSISWPVRAAIACALAQTAAGATAAYPERPIRLVISSAAGGSPDVVTRILAAELVKQMAGANLGHAYMDQKETARFLAQQDELHRRLIEELGMRYTATK